MLSYAQRFSAVASGSATERTHHKPEQLLTKDILLHMVLACSTILGHEVLESQHHVIQELVKHWRGGSSGGASQPTDPDRPSSRASLFNTPEPEPRTCEEVLVRDCVQRPLLRIVLDCGSELEDRRRRGETGR
jgi:hypothetical protein